MQNRIRLIIMLFLSSFILTSCQEIRSVEDIAIIQAAGYDYVDEKQTRGTISVPQFSRAELGAFTSEKYYTATGETLKEIHSKLQGKSSRPLVHGKLRLNIYGEELAENDISFLLDNLIRDASLGREIYLTVVEGEAKDLIEGEYSENERTSRYIGGILDNNIQENFPTTNLHNFIYAYNAEGMDGFMPLLKKSGEHVIIKGIAFFKKGKYVHSIPFSDSFVFKVMKEDFKHGNRKVHFKDQDIVIENIGSDVRYHVKGRMDDPKFLIDINVTGIVNETTRFGMPEDPKFISKVKKKFAKDIEERCTELLKEFQEENIDPIGLGNVMKSRDRRFDNKQWKEKYPSAKIDVNVNVQINETGISQ
ncbi:Ger(x)C family spore germination protein [Bacillus sp. Marseille-Q3570]|uniref:Ger(x)C family spore germination protein n=1 Tax=Bacillus sp. Marseille-Q3570 TaxID=2963522 RepID=UPI0021B6EA04|nr:Ger(x)C family spore germination protein [Bacillus sp. Marseille-Q3570]